MTFNPLGYFNPNAAIDPKYIQIGRDHADALASCPDGTIVAGYYHWSADHYNQTFTDYNDNIAYNPATGLFSIDITHNAQDNAIGVNNNAEASHTWLRNTGGFGIATDDMVGGGENNFGPEPLTIETLWYLCTAAAGVSKKYNLDVMGNISNNNYAGGSYNGETVWKTHAEAAVRGGNPVVSPWYNYGPSGTVERWDLASFVPLPEGESVTDATATICGNSLRLLTHRIKALL